MRGWSGYDERRTAGMHPIEIGCGVVGASFKMMP